MTAGTEERHDRLVPLQEQNAESIRITGAAVQRCTEYIEAMAKRNQERCDRLDRTIDRLARLVEDVVRLNHENRERLGRLEAR